MLRPLGAPFCLGAYAFYGIVNGHLTTNANSGEAHSCLGMHIEVLAVAESVQRNIGRTQHGVPGIQNRPVYDRSNTESL